MNPYTTMTRSWIQPGDIAKATLTDPITAAAALAVLERTRAYQSEAEIEGLLKQHGVRSHTTASLVAMLRQSIGSSLVRLGERLGATSASGASPAPTPVSGMLAPAA